MRKVVVCVQGPAGADEDTRNNFTQGGSGAP